MMRNGLVGTVLRLLGLLRLLRLLRLLWIASREAARGRVVAALSHTDLLRTQTVGFPREKSLPATREGRTVVIASE